MKMLITGCIGIASVALIASEPIDSITGASYQIPPFPPMESSLAKATLSDWLEKHWMLALSTVSPDGQPHIAPVSYLSKGTTVFIRSLKNTNKIRNLLQNPNVAYTVWDASDGFENARSLQMIAKASIVTEPEAFKLLNEQFNIAPGSVFAESQKEIKDLGWLEAHRQAVLPNTVIVKIEPVLARWIDQQRRPGPGEIIRFDQASEATGTTPETEQGRQQ